MACGCVCMVLVGEDMLYAHVYVHICEDLVYLSRSQSVNVGVDICA